MENKSTGNVILAKHLALVALLLSFILVVYYRYHAEAERFAEMWRPPNYAVQKLEINNTTPKALKGNNLEVNRINNQIIEINDRIISQFDILKLLYSRYYFLIILATMTSVAAAIILLIITKSGWTNTSSYIITAFLILLTFATSSTAYINIFNLDKNITDNKALYIQYIAMKIEISSYITNGEGIDGKEVKLSKFIHNIDKKLVSLNPMALGFDATQIPDYRKIVKDPPQ